MSDVAINLDVVRACNRIRAGRVEGEVGMGGVIVTVAASGIGRACAEALVDDGRPVALWDLSPDVTSVADGLGMTGTVVHVCDSTAMLAALEPADRALGGIDGLVHAAGRVIPEPVGAYTEDSWDAVLDVNVRAQALLVQMLLPH
jgi:NADP-dependent 3-hydroxy acid dehydrogenase YdfG